VTLKIHFSLCKFLPLFPHTMFSDRANFIGLCILFIVVRATYSVLSSSEGSNGAFGISYDERGIAKVSVSNK